MGGRGYGGGGAGEQFFFSSPLLNEVNGRDPSTQMVQKNAVMTKTGHDLAGGEHLNIRPNTGRQNKTTKQLCQMQISMLHTFDFFFIV